MPTQKARFVLVQSNHHRSGIPSKTKNCDLHVQLTQHRGEQTRSLLASGDFLSLLTFSADVAKIWLQETPETIYDRKEFDLSFRPSRFATQAKARVEHSARLPKGSPTHHPEYFRLCFLSAAYPVYSAVVDELPRQHETSTTT